MNTYDSCARDAMKVCDEIINKDEIHKLLNSEILDLEEEFMKGLSEEKRNQYLKLESLTTKITSHDILLIYTNLTNEMMNQK